MFGTAPPGAYARWLLVQWRYAFPLLWILVIVRARSSAMWIVVALAIVLTHSLIAHKEYRFVFPAFACLVVVAALGSADLVERARRLLRPVAWRGLIVATALLWVGTSAALAFTGPFRDQWFKARGVILSSFALAKIPDLCGVLFYDAYWFDTGGYTYLHRDVPFYVFDHRAAPAHLIRSTESFNAVVLKRSSIADFADRFRLQQCFAAPNSADVCVMLRDGPCRHELAMNAFLAPHMSLPGTVQSTNPAWTTDVPGRVWHEKDNSGPSAWIRRGNSNVFDVAGCVNRFCGGKALSIVRSGSEVMVLRPGLGKANDVVYLGILSGTHVSGWFPGGPWTADIAD